uniref:Zinc knuckle CX2CX4HX4C n=1 Tax=Tanacetum cinerariifolium TaxID=118510 RepID=A0A6L2NJY4_TANCI|nr:hypothetical protein [Tanacetum cinerariifolium]
MNKSPSSYDNKLSPESLTKANIQKIKANVPNGDDYDIWLPLAYFHEVNDQMKNYLYGYFIGKKLAFLVVEWLDGYENWYSNDACSYMNSTCLESWGLSGYAIILIEINACNEFSDHSVMVVLNLEGNGYTKETIHIEYEWEPPRCSTCLIFGHSLVDFPKDAPKRVKSGGNNDGTKNFTILVKPKTQYRPKAKQSTEGTSNSLKMTPFVGTNKASTSCYNKESPSNKGDKINVVEKQILEGKIMFVVDDGKPLEKVDCPDNSGSNDQVENKMASFLVSKPMGVRYGLKILLEQWRKNNVDDD